MNLRFLGADRQVTGSCYLLDVAGLRILIDCGLFQERQFQDRNWDALPVPLDSINVLLLTHAHLDHCGRIPRLVKLGLRCPIYSTEPSCDLTGLVLLDSAGLQEEDAQYKRERHQREARPSPRPVEPLYTRADAEETLKRLKRIRYDEPIKLNDRVTVTYHDAGHVLGSAFLSLDVQENGRNTCLVFSGDIGQHNKPIIRDPEVLDRADIVVMESTYGDRDHDHSRPVLDALAEEISLAAQAGGNLLIPTFAIERAQELLFYLKMLLDAKRIPPTCVFLDSPMAVDATELFERYQTYMDDEARQLFKQGKGPLRFPGLHLCKTREESQAINSIRGGAIIMAGSGMCTGGRIKHHLRHNLDNPSATVLFVGFQSPGTLGREILDGNPQVRIHGEMHAIKARIRQISGMSAHADRTGLLEWIGSFKSPPKRVFLTHGEEQIALGLADELRRRGSWEVTVPHYGDSVELI